MNKKITKLTTEDIVLSILKYQKGDENSTTTNYFKLGDMEFPIMRIVKEAMIINGSFQEKDYDDLFSCKTILEQRLDLTSKHFHSNSKK